MFLKLTCNLNVLNQTTNLFATIKSVCYIQISRIQQFRQHCIPSQEGNTFITFGPRENDYIVVHETCEEILTQLKYLRGE